MKPRITIVVYKPLEGKESTLLHLVTNHHHRLLQENLVTSRKPIICQAKDNSLVEIFEWQSEEAIHAAHANPAVLAMWKEFGEACTYMPIADIYESNNMFSDFTPVN